MKDNENCPFFISWKMYYCYILYSTKLDKYYIGSTGDLEGRLQRHNNSNHGFTTTGKPWEIKYFETFESKELALIRELQLKNWKNRKAIEKLISGD
jgi:putative endonuclease